MTTASTANNEPTEVEALFAKVTSVENTLNNTFSDANGVEQSLQLYGLCMGIVAESTTVSLTDAQRAEFAARMDKIDEKLQEQAMEDFFS